MVVRFDVRLDVKARTGEVVACCGGHKMGGGSFGMVRLRAEGETAMGGYLRRTKVRRQEHSFDEHLCPSDRCDSTGEHFSANRRNFWRNVWTPSFLSYPLRKLMHMASLTSTARSTRSNSTARLSLVSVNVTIDTSSDLAKFVLSCDGCVMAKSAACTDCVVTYLCGTNAAEFGGSPRHELSPQEFATLSSLQAVGMAPANRHLEAHPSRASLRQPRHLALVSDRVSA